jgi:hypothetical protein
MDSSFAQKSSWRRNRGAGAVPQKPIATAAISLGPRLEGELAFNNRQLLGENLSADLACKNGQCKRRAGHNVCALRVIRKNNQTVGNQIRP